MATIIMQTYAAALQCDPASRSLNKENSTRLCGNQQMVSSVGGCALQSSARAESKEDLTTDRDTYAVSDWVFTDSNGGQFRIYFSNGILHCPVFSVDNVELVLHGRFAANEKEAAKMMSDVKAGNLDFFVAENKENSPYKFRAMYLVDGSLEYRDFNNTTFGPKNNGDAVFKTHEDFILDSRTYSPKYSTPVDKA